MFVPLKTRTIHRLSAIVARSLLVLALFGTPILASATTIVGQSIEEMSADAELVVWAEVESSAVRVVHQKVFTETTFRVVEIWRGELEDTHFVLRSPGGLNEGVLSYVPGVESFRVGDRVVAFLEVGDATTWKPLSLSWSVFHVEGETARRSTTGLSVQPPHPLAHFRPRSLDANALPLSELRDRVRTIPPSAP